MWEQIRNQSSRKKGKVMKIVYLLAILIIFAILIFIVSSKRNINPEVKESSNIKIGEEEFFITTSSENDTRAASVLPMFGSEDASHILGDLGLPSTTFEEKDKDYLPDKNTDWIVSAEFEDKTEFTPDQIGEDFGEEWRKKYGGLVIYGFDPDSGFWTYVICADGPKRVTKLKFAWSYYSSWNDEPVSDEDMYRNRVVAVENSLKKIWFS